MTRKLHSKQRRMAVLHLAVAFAMVVSALFFSYQATDKTHFQRVSSEMSSAPDVHYAMPGKHLPAKKWLLAAFAAGWAILLYVIPIVRLLMIPLALLRAFIPLRLKALLLLPVKFTSRFTSAAQAETVRPCLSDEPFRDER